MGQRRRHRHRLRTDASTREATSRDDQQLEREQWLGYPIPEGGSSQGFNETLALRGFGSWKTMALGSFHAQVKLLEGGFGLALLRRACIRAQLEQGRLVEIEAPVPVATPIFLIWRRNAYLGEIGEYIRDRICATQPPARTGARLRSRRE